VTPGERERDSEAQRLIDLSNALLAAETTFGRLPAESAKQALLHPRPGPLAMIRSAFRSAAFL
jgi:hypothetical protein